MPKSNYKRRASEGIPPLTVDSSNLSVVEYDEKETFLVVLFQSGWTYAYEGVPAYLVTRLLAARSLGKFFHTHIRFRFNYYPVD